MNPKVKRIRSLAALSLLALCACNAQANESLSVQLDNDILFGTDREYTGGLKIYYNDGHFKLNDKIIEPLHAKASHLFPKMALIHSHTHDQLEVSAEIYTIKQKKEGKTLNALTNTAWVSVASKRFYQYVSQKDQPAFYHLGARVGWIGPSNGGEQLQNGFHQMIGNQTVDGWDHQPFDQPTLQISFERQKIFYQSRLKALNAYYTTWGELGSPRTDLYVGLGSYWQHNAHPIFYHNQANHIFNKKSRMGIFAFANVNGSYDFYNLMRDGRPFTQDAPLIPSLSPWRLEMRLGAGLAMGQSTLCFTVTHWQQFYSEQPESAFHYASLAYSFNL